MKYQTEDNLQMYYEVKGNTESSQTLVFIGGLTQSTAAWMGYVSLEQDYKIVLIDLIFQGQSDAAPEARSFDGHAKDVYNLLNHIGINKAIVIGISYGSAVLLRLMVNHPNLVEKGIVMAGFAHKTPLFNALGLAWARALECGGYELMLDVMLPSVLSDYYFEHPIIPIDTIKMARKDNPPAVDNIMKLMQATAESGDYRPELSKVQCPTLVIVGATDVLTTPTLNKAIADAIPNAQYEEIPNVGHTLNLEAIPQTIQFIKLFVDA